MFNPGSGATNSPALSQGTEESSGHKHHKNKKKKKKNKHKHKHKHKKDKEREGHGSSSLPPDFLPSSGPSNTNSPSMANPPSSPDFEVI